MATKLNPEQVSQCNHVPKYEIVFDVAGQQKAYHLCSKCADLDIFGKFLVSKQQIKTTSQHSGGDYK